MPVWESACRLRACDPQWPTVEQPQPRWERSAAMVTRRTLGQYSSLSPSPAHLSHTTNITLSRIKCEKYIFIKKCVRSFIEVRHYVWLWFAYICIYMWLYKRLTFVPWIKVLYLQWESGHSFLACDLSVVSVHPFQVPVSYNWIIYLWIGRVIGSTLPWAL